MKLISFREARAPALAAFALLSVAAAISSAAASQLSGYTYIDRNNDGQLAFTNQAQPEWVISGMEVKLYAVSGSSETLLSTTLTNTIGMYVFNGLPAGTYTIRQTQPVEYVDGIETAGIIRSLLSGSTPPGANVGTLGPNAFLNISLPIDSRGDFFNFAERGMAPGYVSKRYLLGTAPLPVITPLVEIEGEPPTTPEPASGALAAFAALGILAMRRRDRR